MKATWLDLNRSIRDLTTYLNEESNPSRGIKVKGRAMWDKLEIDTLKFHMDGASRGNLEGSEIDSILRDENENTLILFFEVY